MEGSEYTICGSPIKSERRLCYESASYCGEIRQMHTAWAKNSNSAIFTEKKNHLIRDLEEI